ncbi:MAG: hypothetical protein ACI87H_002999 [Gammaproteobacteria bacterium]|jgi:hypothetical protein
MHQQQYLTHSRRLDIKNPPRLMWLLNLYVTLKQVQDQATEWLWFLQ